MNNMVFMRGHLSYKDRKHKRKMELREQAHRHTMELEALRRSSRQSSSNNNYSANRRTSNKKYFGR